MTGVSFRMLLLKLKNSDDRSVTVYASGEWIQLTKAGIIEPQKIEGFTVNKFIEMALLGTNWNRGKQNTLASTR